MVQVLDVRPYDPPRAVEVELGGQWWPGVQHCWRLCNDDRGWMADVEFVANHTWGLGKYRPMVPAERVRPRSDNASVDNNQPVDDSGTRSPVT